MPRAIRAQVFCFECLEQHGKIAADEDRARDKTSQQLKRMSVHSLKPPFHKSEVMGTVSRKPRAALDWGTPLRCPCSGQASSRNIRSGWEMTPAFFIASLSSLEAA